MIHIDRKYLSEALEGLLDVLKKNRNVPRQEFSLHRSQEED